MRFPNSEIGHNLHFRDHLRNHSEDRKHYSRMKHMTVEQNSIDAQNYRDNKDLFIKLTKYNPASPKELAYKERMLELLKNTPNCFERSSLKAHFTASAWLLNKAGDKALLMHHTKLDRWFQLGGHADGDHNLLRVAIKESQEESGINQIVAVDSNIFDIDIHPIPARGDKEPGHEHFDVRFLLEVTSDEDVIQNGESKELRWIGKNRKELPTDSESVVRMFDKWTLDV
ncbi:MAG: GrpB family protein [Myxococcaceae bacterium]